MTSCHVFSAAVWPSACHSLGALASPQPSLRTESLGPQHVKAISRLSQTRKVRTAKSKNHADFETRDWIKTSPQPGTRMWPWFHHFFSGTNINETMSGLQHAGLHVDNLRVHGFYKSAFEVTIECTNQRAKSKHVIWRNISQSFLYFFFAAWSCLRSVSVFGTNFSRQKTLTNVTTGVLWRNTYMLYIYIHTIHIHP